MTRRDKKTKENKFPVVKVVSSYKPNRGVYYILARLGKISVLIREIECKFMENEPTPPTWRDRGRNLEGDMRDRTHKYNAKRTVVDGITFDSRKEARRYGELKLLEKAGEIIYLKTHPSFPIVIDGKNICVVELDFSYSLRHSPV